jgi:hypothetical protein
MFSINLERLETALAKRSRGVDGDSLSLEDIDDALADEASHRGKEPKRRYLDKYLKKTLARLTLEDDGSRQFDIGWPTTPRSLREHLGLETKVSHVPDDFISDTFYNFVKSPVSPDLASQAVVPQLDNSPSQALLDPKAPLTDAQRYAKLVADCGLAPKVMEDGIERLHAVKPRRRPKSPTEQQAIFKRLTAKHSLIPQSMSELLLAQQPKRCHPLPVAAPKVAKPASSAPRRVKPKDTIWSIAHAAVDTQR